MQIIPVCSRGQSVAARGEAPPLPAGPQPWDRLGGVQCSGLAEPRQAQPCCPECCHAAAGFPEVRRLYLLFIRTESVVHNDKSCVFSCAPANIPWRNLPHIESLYYYYYFILYYLY